jgi:hypothetical protein
MKQTVVEWLESCLTEQYQNGSFVWNTKADIEALFEQAKEMEKQQQDEFAIGFGQWLVSNCYSEDDIYWWLIKTGGDVRKSTEELLEIYKKEKGL